MGLARIVSLTGGAAHMHVLSTAADMLASGGK